MKIVDLVGTFDPPSKVPLLSQRLGSSVVVSLLMVATIPVVTISVVVDVTLCTVSMTTISAPKPRKLSFDGAYRLEFANTDRL